MDHETQVAAPGSLRDLIAAVQVNIPCTMLTQGYRELFVQNALNPEIGLDAAALDGISLERHERLADSFHQRGRTITLHGPFMDLSPGSPDPEVIRVTRHRLQQMAELAALYRPAAVVCHAGYDASRYAFCREEWGQRALETWSWAADRVARAGSRLVLENVYERHPGELVPLFDDLASQGVGFCLDAGHLSAFGKMRLEEWLPPLGSRIRHLHLHDNDGVQDDHLALGDGHIDFAPLVDFLVRKSGADVIVTLEPHNEKDLWRTLRYLDENEALRRAILHPENPPSC
jgi:sugar phosphate isomerase/epimerase